MSSAIKQETLQDLLNRKPIDVSTKFKPLLRKARKVSTLLGLDDEILDTIISLSQGQHVCLVGLPGVGKTTLAKELAAAANVPYSRTDGNEDVEPSQIIGYIDKIAVAQLGIEHPLAVEIGDMLRAHGGVYHIDEINRIPPRAANALLQGLEEGYVWLSGYKIISSFVAIATLNPATVTGVYDLDEALIDRFDMIYLRTPNVNVIENVLKLRANLSGKIEVKENVFKVAAKMIDLMVRDFERNEKLDLPASVRAGISAINRALSYAEFRNSSTVELSDLKRAIVPSFAGRIRPSADIGTEYADRVNLVLSYFEHAIREVSAGNV